MRLLNTIAFTLCMICAVFNIMEHETTIAIMMVVLGSVNLYWATRS